MEAIVFGLSHETTPVELREKIGLDREEEARAIVELKAAGVPEGAILSTCNRVEIVCAGAPIDQLERAARGVLCRAKPALARIEETGGTYLHSGPAAARHLFRVACGLDSAVLGEAQILGQVRSARETARAAGFLGSFLDRLFQAAIAAGKRVRAQTEIGAGAASVASAAVELATRIHGDLSHHTALVLGAGETAELASRILVEKGIGGLVIVNRTQERAVELARPLGARGVSLETLAEELLSADIVIGTTGSPTPLVDRALVLSALAGRAHRAHRAHRKLALIDIAVPRDFDPAIADSLENCFLYNIDDLTRIVDQNLEMRSRWIPRALKILEEELARFQAWLSSLDFVPVIRSLQDHFDSVLAETIERHKSQFPAAQWPRVEEFARFYSRRLLHGPVSRLRNGGVKNASARTLAGILSDLFGRVSHDADDPDRD